MGNMIFKSLIQDKYLKILSEDSSHQLAPILLYFDHLTVGYSFTTNGLIHPSFFMHLKYSTYKSNSDE